jgi:DNA recombination protein RmuC
MFMELLILIIVLIVLVTVNIWLTYSHKGHGQTEELKNRLSAIESVTNRIDPLIREEFGRNRSENQDSFKQNREEQMNSLKVFQDTITKTISELSGAQKSQFDTFSTQLTVVSKQIETNLKEIRETMERKLMNIQQDNNTKLEEMKQVVDEKLQKTLEDRFNKSFTLISQRLEEVHKGLGEMQTLATGVGDLKKVLTNVKTRGNLGEIQLGAILEQVLSPEQYEQNAVVKENSQERVEYVIKLPGRSINDQSLFLPIDSKFPNEDYQRLLDAYENMGNLSPKDIETISKQFENSVKKNAKDIREKYINPPVTTDFAIMFVPTEGLYAEILRRTGLFETLQRDFKITVVGPTNLVAFLSSLQMGFKTLAIEKRSSEVWELLGAVKTEFGNFGSVLEKTKKKLLEAANVIDSASVRTRAIERKLKNVQELPQDQTVALRCY